MDHAYRSQVFATSTWNGLQDIGTMPDAASMIAAGESGCAWPVGIGFDRIVTGGGLPAPGRAVVATYANATSKALGIVGKKYRATTPAEWRDLVTAAVAAGAAPTGVFQIGHGARVVATFDLGGNGVRSNLVLADSFDGSMKLTCGVTSIRMRCANQMGAVMRDVGAGMAGIGHTASLESKVKILQEAIGEAVKTGDAVRATFHAAESTILTNAAGDAVFDKLFPQAEEGATARAKTIAESARQSARTAMANPVNAVDAAPGGVSLATIWNAATFLVDRNADGTQRATRGDSDLLESLLFGSRAKRIEEVQACIEVVMASGELQRFTIDQARDHGIDDRQMGRAMLAEMLEG